MPGYGRFQPAYANWRPVKELDLCPKEQHTTIINFAYVSMAVIQIQLKVQLYITVMNDCIDL